MLAAIGIGVAAQCLPSVLSSVFGGGQGNASVLDQLQQMQKIAQSVAMPFENNQQGISLV
jgi:hypothetical protein